MVLSVLGRLATAVAAAQLLGLSGQVSAAAFRLQERGGEEPGLPYDPATTSHCSWWLDHDGSQTCQEILDFNWIKLSDFRRWNPSVGSDCGGLASGKSYCVEAWGEPAPPPEPTTTTTTTAQVITTTTAAPTTTKPPTTIITTTTTTTAGNGVETPAPVHAGIVKNCNKFHLVESGDTCGVIAQKYGLRTADVVSYNGLNSGCTNLWGDTYACVGLIGSTPTAPQTTTTTSVGNGVATPAPVQNGIVKNCNKFHFVESGDTCAVIAQKYSLRTADVVSWNGLNSGCTNIWGDTYACVGLIGGSTPVTTTKPPATTTTPSNGVSTPAPVHNGIVKNCNKFHMVQGGETCAVIAQKYNVRVADVVSWNGLNSGCTNIWSDTYACIGLIGGSTPVTTTKPPTTTTAGNGVATPTPVQGAIVKNCNKFHMVKGGETCAVIAQKYNIKTADVVSWNGLNSGCTNIWSDTYACVGLIGQTTPPPTTTKPPTGPVTPSPIQAGMVKGCTKWHFIGGTTTCSQVLSYQKITMAQFFKWNPAVKADCSGMWKDTHACVAGP